MQEMYRCADCRQLHSGSELIGGYCNFCLPPEESEELRAAQDEYDKENPRGFKDKI